MKNVYQRDLSIISAIEIDLVSARREGRFEDALHHLDEIFVVHKHTDCDETRARCVVLLLAPETLQRAA
ncbi:MAG: hypothetical protein WAV72_30650 [Bradyrhizobium sp.]